MPGKIMVLTHKVDDYLQKQASFLHLPLIKEKYYNEYEIGDYCIFFELDEPVIDCLSATTCVYYHRYFDKNCSLREQCFDCIRALGLKELWAFDEILYDVFGDKDGYELKEAIEKIDLEWHEFVRDEVNENDYYSYYHDSFKDLFEKVELLECKFDVHVLGLRWKKGENGDRFIRILKDKSVYWMNEITGELSVAEDNTFPNFV